MEPGGPLLQPGGPELQEGGLLAVAPPPAAAEEQAEAEGREKTAQGVRHEGSLPSAAGIPGRLFCRISMLNITIVLKISSH